jgi:hypothetical protein
MSPPPSGIKSKPSKKPARNRQLTFSTLHGNISQKMELFVTIAENLKSYNSFIV